MRWGGSLWLWGSVSDTVTQCNTMITVIESLYCIEWVAVSYKHYIKCFNEGEGLTESITFCKGKTFKGLCEFLLLYDFVYKERSQVVKETTLWRYDILWLFVTLGLCIRYCDSMQYSDWITVLHWVTTSYKYYIKCFCGGRISTSQ